jgi:hypothetical protein
MADVKAVRAAARERSRTRGRRVQRLGGSAARRARKVRKAKRRRRAQKARHRPSATWRSTRYSSRCGPEGAALPLQRRTAATANAASSAAPLGALTSSPCRAQWHCPSTFELHALRGFAYDAFTPCARACRCPRVGRMPILTRTGNPLRPPAADPRSESRHRHARLLLPGRAGRTGPPAAQPPAAASALPSTTTRARLGKHGSPLRVVPSSYRLLHQSRLQAGGWVRVV